MAVSSDAFNDDETPPAYMSASTGSAPPAAPPASSGNLDNLYSMLLGQGNAANGDDADADADAEDDDVSVNVGDLGDVNDLDRDLDAQYSSLSVHADADDDDFLRDDMSDDPVIDAHRAQFGSALAQLPAAKDDDDNSANITTTSSGFDYFYDSPTASPTSAASSTALVAASSSSSFIGPTIGPQMKSESNYGNYGSYGSYGSSYGSYGSSYGSYGSSYGSNNKQQRVSIRNAFTGLSNQGATCYMNSLLQTMFMTPELRLGLYRWQSANTNNDGTNANANVEEDADEDNIPFQLQKLFAKLQITTQESISTKALTKSFGWTGADVFQQHDVQELCRVLFDALEKSFKGTVNETLVNDLYQGTMKDYVQCRTCGYESSRQDEFLDLSLVIRPFGSTQMMRSVEEAIEFFLKPEVLNGGNQWMCDRCQTKRDAIKGLKFSKLPYLLSLQLKRFDYDYMTDSRVKLHDQVTFPKYLDMNSYVHDKEGGGARGSIARKMSMERHELEGGVPRTTAASATATAATAAAETEAVAARMRRLSSMDEAQPIVSFSDEDGIPAVSIAGSSGGSVADTWSAGFDVDELIATSGPHVYELYSVLIHSGSAMGGHYYAYIKSFESDKWYDFNDSTVSELSETEVKKAWGGSGSGSNSYGGRISYSTCAYMLMYRLVSRETNINATPKESIPESLVERMREDEDRHRRQELERIELTKKMLIKFYIKTNSRNKIEKSIHVYKTATLKETLAVAHEAFAKELQGAMPALHNTRIRLYNDHSGLLTDAYEGREDKTLTQLRMYSSYQLYLEWKKDDEEWEPYETNKLQLYMRRFQIPHQGAPSTWLSPDEPDMTARYVQLPDNATIAMLLALVAKKFDIPAGKKIRLVRKTATSYTATPVKVLNRDESPATLSARLRADHHLTNATEVFFEECDDLTAPSIAEQHFEREVNLIDINVWYLDRHAETIRMDRRETVGALKQKMATKLDLDIDKFKILRGSHRAGVEIKGMELTLFKLSMAQSTVFALEGTPLGVGEYLFRLMLSVPSTGAATSASTSGGAKTIENDGESTLTVSNSKGKGEDDETDLFDLDELMIRTNQEEHTLEYISNIKVAEEMPVDEIRQLVWTTLQEKAKLPEDGSITPDKIRLRDVQSTTLTRILVDSCCLKDASTSPVYEGRSMVAQLLSEPEHAQAGHRLIHVVYVDRSKWRFCKRRRFQLVVPKEYVGEDPSTDDEEDEGDSSFMDPSTTTALTVSTISRPSKKSWHTSSSQALVSTWIPEQIAQKFTIPPEQARFAVFAFDRDTFDICEIFKTDFDTWDRCLAELRDRQYNYQLMVFVADADVPVGGLAARERMHIQDFLAKKKEESSKLAERSYSSYSYSSNYRKPKEAALVIRTKSSKTSDKNESAGGGSTTSSTGGKSVGTASVNGGVTIRTPTTKRVAASSDTDEDEEYAGVHLFD